VAAGTSDAPAGWREASASGILDNKTGGATLVFEIAWTGTVSRNEPENIEEL